MPRLFAPVRGSHRANQRQCLSTTTVGEHSHQRLVADGSGKEEEPCVNRKTGALALKRAPKEERESRERTAGLNSEESTKESRKNLFAPTVVARAVSIGAPRQR
jgi:hypothetical protein